MQLVEQEVVRYVCFIHFLIKPSHFEKKKVLSKTKKNNHTRFIMEGTVSIYDVKCFTSYENSLIVIKEFETKSNIKGYHAYMYHWKPIIEENISTRPELENIIDKYQMVVLKDRRVAGHVIKIKSSQYTETIFYFFWANYWNTSEIIVKGKGVNYRKMGRACKCLPN